MRTNGLVRGFVENGDIPWEDVGQGIQRKVMAYDENLMLVRVKFESGGIGTVHKHPHSQITHVESGAFEIEINGEKRVLRKDDAYYVPPETLHGAVCIDDGVLIDVFSPMREDFIG